VARSRLEPGCIAHAVHPDPENALRLIFVERWASPETLWAHLRVPASRAFGKALAGLASEAPEMTVYEATPVALPACRPPHGELKHN
jgi:quinol monooxygenase YgiN